MPTANSSNNSILILLLLLVIGTTYSVGEKNTFSSTDANEYNYLVVPLNRTTIVHLFEWKWLDVANECEQFLKFYDYGVVQVSPPHEHPVIYKNDDIPWWVKYQVVSYQLTSRSGTEAEFIQMINRCNAVGVRIIVDMVLNHLVGTGLKRGVNGVTSSGTSDFDSRHGSESFPGVPYDRNHTNNFRCDENIQERDYTSDANRVRNCRLVGLIDLNQEHEHVREKMVEYLNKIIDLGVAGFRFDASKHMWPQDLQKIVYQIKNLRQDIFGVDKRPFIFHEVIDYGNEAVKTADYLPMKIGRYTDFVFGLNLSRMARNDFSELGRSGSVCMSGTLAASDGLVFIDNHDNQREPGKVITHKDQSLYAMVVGYMLACTGGYPRVMSSYYFENLDQGPPSQLPQNVYKVRSPIFDQQFKTCATSSGWVCEHRWRAIRNMAKFRRVVLGSDVTLISAVEGSNQLAFARDGKGFFAVNNANSDWSIRIKTKLPAGLYCDCWSSDFAKNTCTGQVYGVDDQSFMDLTVPSKQFRAFHIEMKLSTTHSIHV